MIRPTRVLFVLTIALLVVTGCNGTHQETRPPHAPAIVSPRGETDWPITFRWNRVEGGDWIYRVVVLDSAQRVLMEQDTRAAAVGAPSDLKPMLVSGGPFTWQVQIVDGDGKPLSEPTSAPLALR